MEMRHREIAQQVGMLCCSRWGFALYNDMHRLMAG